MMKPELIVGLALLLGIACKPTAPQQSTTQHKWGETKVSGFASTRCKVTNETKYIYPDSGEYLSKLAHFIMNKNSDTFGKKGEFSPSNFCLDVHQDRIFNASAYSDSAKIVFNTGLIRSATSDA